MQKYSLFSPIHLFRIKSRHDIWKGAKNLGVEWDCLVGADQGSGEHGAGGGGGHPDPAAAGGEDREGGEATPHHRQHHQVCVMFVQ